MVCLRYDHDSVGYTYSGPGIHLSSQTEIVESSPILFSKPTCDAFFPSMIAHHVAEAFFGAEACMKSQEGKYLPLRTRAHSEVGSVSSRQPCLHNIAILNICSS